MNAVVKPNTGFALAPTNLDEAYNFADRISRTELVPKNYKGKPDECLVAMMMGTEIGLNPIQSLQNIAVINGKPSIYGDSMLALVMHHPAFGSIKETFDENAMAATCHVTRKGGSENTETYSRTDAETAGLWGKQGPWQQHPKRMLKMRARGFALRNLFADALAGLISREEAEDMPVNTNTGEPVDVTPQREALPQLETYTEQAFGDRLTKWQASVNQGKQPSDIIATVSTKYALTEEQRNQIMALEPQQQEQAQ